MEKREPSLVPEWLRSTGNGSSVGSKNHILSSSARSDSSLLLNNSKTRNPRTKATDVDSPPFLDRSCSTNSRRGSTKNAYSNFNVQRSNRDKDRSSRESYIDHPWDHDTSFPFGSFLNEVQLRRSNSMTSRKQDDHPGFSMGFKDGRSIFNRNGILPPAQSSERNQDVVRISSPCLSPAVVGGNSSLTPGEHWTSALAEVPIVIDKSASDPVAANVATLTGQTRNMAEALLQPPRTSTPPQESSKIQRLEDRALKLIPVLPSTPKGSVLSSSGIHKDATVEEVMSTHRRRRHRIPVLNLIEDEIDKCKMMASREDDVGLWRYKEDKFKRKFSTKQTWSQLRTRGVSCEWSKGIWFTYATPKFAFLAWVTIKNRLSTGERMQGWGGSVNTACSLCGDPLETRNHLFFDCGYSAEVWGNLVRGLMGNEFTCDWSEIVALISTNQNTIKTFTLKYVFQATIHGLWLERNGRRHGEAPQPTTTMIRLIDRGVRNRFLSIQRAGDDRWQEGLQHWFSTRPVS